MEEEQKPMEEPETPAEVGGSETPATPEAEPQSEPAEEAPAAEAEAPVEEGKGEEETPVEAPTEEEAAPAKEPQEEEKEEAPAAECSCSVEESKGAEDLIRDLINLIKVYKEEEKQDVTTRIDPDTAEILAAKLEEVAKKVGEICVCG